MSILFIGSPDLVQRYFDKKDFYFQDYKDLGKEHNTTSIVKNDLPQTSSIEKPVLDNSSIEEKLLKVKREIIKYEPARKTNVF